MKPPSIHEDKHDDDCTFVDPDLEIIAAMVAWGDELVASQERVREIMEDQ